jgi:hypothetical protein
MYHSITDACNVKRNVHIQAHGFRRDTDRDAAEATAEEFLATQDLSSLVFDRDAYADDATANRIIHAAERRVRRTRCGDWLGNTADVWLEISAMPT